MISRKSRHGDDGAAFFDTLMAPRGGRSPRALAGAPAQPASSTSEATRCALFASHDPRVIKALVYAHPVLVCTARLHFVGFPIGLTHYSLLFAGERKRDRMAATRQPSHTREEIIDIAFNLVDKLGYDGFSMRTLGDELGMSAMGVYSYFKSKDDLLRAVLGKAQGMVDTNPIPGEYWEDTLHRVCESMRAVNLAHPHIRLMRYRISGPWSQEYDKTLYQLFLDQGMPQDVHAKLFRMSSSYISGFLEPACRNLVLQAEAGQEAQCATTPWEILAHERFTEEDFHEGIDIIIDGLKAQAAPDPCDWRTPEQPQG